MIRNLSFMETKEVEKGEWDLRCRELKQISVLWENQSMPNYWYNKNSKREVKKIVNMINVFLFFKVGVQLLYHVVLVSAVQQDECFSFYSWNSQMISVREAKAIPRPDGIEWRNKYICVEGSFPTTSFYLPSNLYSTDRSTWIISAYISCKSNTFMS